MYYTSLYIKNLYVKLLHNTITVYTFFSQIDNYKYKYILKIYSCVNNITRNIFEGNVACNTHTKKGKFWRLKTPLK